MNDARPVRSRRMTAWLLPVGLAVALIAGCGGEDDGEEAPAAAASSSVPAEVTERLAQYSAEPEFVAPGPAFDASKAAGKKVFNIPISSAIPFVQTTDEVMQEVAERFDIEFVEFRNQGTPTEWTKGIEQAINQKADLINLQAAPEPSIIQPALKEAKRAGIPVVVTHWYDLSQETAPNVTAQTPVDYTIPARIMADWAIADSEGKANIVVVQSSEAPPSAPMVAAIEDEVGKHCPDCELEVLDVAVAEWATKIQTIVQSAIVKNPNVKYVFPLFDGMAPFAASGVTAAGKTGQVQIATFNGTPDVLKMIQDADVVAADVGENLAWIAYANMDQIMRVLAGESPIENPNYTFRLFTDENVGEAGTPPAVNQGYGDAYETGYEELWAGG